MKQENLSIELNEGQTPKIENTSRSGVRIPPGADSFEKTEPLFEELKKTIEEKAIYLSDRKLKELSKLINQIRRIKYRSKERSYSENVVRVFTEEELKRFFESLPSEKYKLLFGLQLALSLRISEVVPLKVEQINRTRRTLIIYEKKTGKYIEKPIPIDLFIRLIAYIEAHKEEIENADGYLWFPEAKTGNRKLKEPHLSVDYVRKVFRETIKKAGLNKIYAIRQDGKPLYLFSTHSLRRTGITLFYKKTKDPFLTKLYSGHKKLDTLERYIQLAEKEEIAGLIDRIF